MIKMFLGVAIVYVVIYSIFCFFATLSTKSDEEQASFYETFFKYLGRAGLCLIATMGVIFFIVFNF